MLFLAKPITIPSWSKFYHRSGLLHIFYALFTHFCLGKPRSDKNRNAPRQLKSSIFISLLKKLVPSLDIGYESEIGVGRDGVILL